MRAQGPPAGSVQRVRVAPAKRSPPPNALGPGQAAAPLGWDRRGELGPGAGVRVRVPKTMSRAPAYFVPSRDRSPTPQRADLIRRSLAVFLTRTDPCLVSDLSEELLPEFCSLPLLIECLLDAVYFFLEVIFS